MTAHPKDELQDLLEDRLDPAGRAAVEAHLVGCAACRRELDAARFARRAVQASLAPPEVPPALPGRIRAALDEVDRAAAPHPGRRWTRPVVWLPLAAAAAAGLMLLWPRAPGDLPGGAARDFARYRAAVALDLSTPDPATLEAFFRTRGIEFAVRVFDFGMMGYRLAGGTVHDVAGRRSALFAYTGADGRSLVCQMYEGTLTELPSGAEAREHDGIRFLVYRREGLTLVFWEEGPVVCVLVSDGDPEVAVQLAYAKAVKVA